MILGIDVGGTNIDVVIMKEADWEILTFKTPEAITCLSDFVEKRWPDVKAIGVGIAAWFEICKSKKKIIHAPNLSVIPKLNFSKPFVMDNDANCFAYFASKILGVKNLFGVTVGTGIGGGIIYEGKIYRGCGAAGEIGHTYIGGEKKCKCGGKGHLEAYFGGWALSESKDIKEILSSGEIYESRAFELFCISIANAVLILHPEVVAIGGRIGGRLDEKKVRDGIRKWLPDVLDVKVQIIKDDYAVAKGAAMLARDTLLSA